MKNGVNLRNEILITVHTYYPRRGSEHHTDSTQPMAKFKKNISPSHIKPGTFFDNLKKPTLFANLNAFNKDAHDKDYVPSENEALEQEPTKGCIDW